MSNKMNFTQAIRGFTVVAMAAALVACGGGGSDTDNGAPVTPINPGTTTPVANNPITNTPDASTPVTSNPVVTESLQAYKASSYPAGDPREYMFEQVNAARLKCGFGALHHNTKLDTSAQGHAEWLATNNYGGHYQASGTPRFTGVRVGDRVRAAGYIVGEEPLIAGSEKSGYYQTANHATEGLTTTNFESDLNRRFISGQISAAYHSLGIFAANREVGFGISTRSSLSNNTGDIAVWNAGSQELSQKLAPSAVATYPCDGVSDLGTTHALNEDPNPLSPRDMRAIKAGHPLMVLSRFGTRLSDLAVTMSNAATGTDVAMAAVRTQDNDSNLKYPNEGFAIPDKELEKNTSYLVKFTGKVDGVTFEKSFTFKTAP